MCRISTHLHPLTVAANITQVSHTRLDHVLITLGLLYKSFAAINDNINPLTRETIHCSLEKRWAKADQDAFILALFFNPFFRASLFNKKHPSLVPAALYSTIKRMWERVFPREARLSELYTATIEYYHATKCWTDEVMHLSDVQEIAAMQN